MELPNWLSALMGALIGGAISFATQYFISRSNYKKELRKHQVATVARLSGSLDNLMNAVYRAMEASMWSYYAVETRRYGIAIDLDVPTLLKIERDCLIHYDKIRGDVEIGLSEYWGYVGSEDEKFMDLIGKYRKCRLPADEVKLQFKDRQELEKFRLIEHLSKLREKLEADETSHFSVCKKIVSHLRFFIAPVNK